MSRLIEERVTATRITASINNFDGNVEKWKLAFYEIWRYQMTWGFAYEIAVREGHKGVFVDLLVKPAYAKSAQDMMYDLGYNGLTVYNEDVGLVSAWEHSELNGIELLVIDD